MQHRLEQELYQLIQNNADIFEFIEHSSLDGMWYWDLEMPEHEWMSPKFWQTLGYDPSEKQHLASEWQHIINQEDLQVAFENFTKHCEDPNHPYDQVVRYTHAKGHTVWVRCRGIAIRNDNGQAVRMLGAHTDITELKHTEEKLLETIKSRELFFARMSHEIRTPLHGIIGLTDILKEKNKDSELSPTLETISACGDQLLTLLNDLLTLSKLNDDKLSVSVEPVPVNEIINYVANLYQARAHAKGLEFKVSGPKRIEQLAIQTDKIRMTQVISNLVNNAIKFTSSGFVELKVTTQEQTILISVIDTGRGIDDVDLVFKPYQQEQQSREDEAGTGLGLEIVNRLCSELGHDLDVQSTVGSGTSVTISCPLTLRERSTVVSASAQDESQAEKQLQFGKVLVVDDNEINREIANSMLQGHCSHIDLAADGQEALAFSILNKDYDFILMDLNMPVKDGYRASTEILGLTNLKKEPTIIAVSADAFDETIEACKQVGMHHHLKKPFTKRHLLKAIEQAQSELS
jgi:PAS domain S-box-containing protein